MRLTFLDHLLGRLTRSSETHSLLDDIDTIDILPVRFDLPKPENRADARCRTRQEVQRLVIENARLGDLRIYNEPGCCLIRVNQRSRLVIYPDRNRHAVLSEEQGDDIVIHIYRDIAPRLCHQAL